MEIHPGLSFTYVGRSYLESGLSSRTLPLGFTEEMLLEILCHSRVCLGHHVVQHSEVVSPFHLLELFSLERNTMFNLIQDKGFFPHSTWWGK